MKNETRSAVEFYKKACEAEKNGEFDLAEVYYLKSIYVFEQEGGVQKVNAANTLNTLSMLRSIRGDVNGALRAAKRSVQVSEGCGKARYVELVHDTAQELIRHMA